MRDLLARPIDLWCYSPTMPDWDEDFIEALLMNTGSTVPTREKATHQGTPHSRQVDPKDYQLISDSVLGA